MIHTATYDGSLNFDTKIDTHGFSRGTNTIKSQANGLKSSLAGLGKMMIAAFSVTALVAFGKQAIDTASDLQEVQNVVDTAFGEMSYKMEEFADKAIESFGISKLAAKQTGSTFMAMAHGMGIASDNASDMAISLTGLSADMASFYNVRQDVASTALKSIFTGETETLKQFGIVMTEANLQAFAMSQGIKKNISDMSQAEKVQLRYTFVMNQTSLAQGDFAKTSGSWANQTRVLSERWKEFMSILGQGLIQVLTPAVQFLNTAMFYLIKMATTVSDILSSVFGLEKQIADSTTTIGTSTGDAATGYEELGDAAEKAGKKANGAAAPFDKLNQIASETGSSSAGSGIGASTNISVDTSKTKAAEESNSKLADSFDDLKDAIQPTIDALDNLKSTLKPIAKMGFESLKSFYEDFLKPVGKWVLGEGLPSLLNSLSNLLSDIDWTKLSTAIKNFNKAIAPLAIAVGHGFVAFVRDLSEVLKPVLATTVDLLASAIQAAADAAGNTDADKMKDVGYALGALGAGLAAIKINSTLVTFLLNLKLALGDLATAISNLAYMNPVALPALLDLLGFYEWQEDLFDSLPKWCRDTWNGVWEGIFGAIKEIFTLDKCYAIAEDMAKRFKNAFSGDASWLEIGRDILLGILEGILLVPGAIVETATNLLESIAKHICDAFGIKSPAEKMKPIGKNILLGILEGFTGAFTDWWKKINEWGITTSAKFKTQAANIWSAIKGEFANVPNWFKTKFTEAWTNVKNVFSSGGKVFTGIKEGIAETFRTVVNKLIDGINTIIATPFNKINSMIDTLRKVPIIGDKLGGFRLTVPRIPKLATGTVVPANYGEFLAVLGDNKRETEVVSPVSTMKKAFKEAVAEMGNTGSGGMMHVTITLPNGKVLFDTVVEAEKENYNATGDAIFAH